MFIRAENMFRKEVGSERELDRRNMNEVQNLKENKMQAKEMKTDTGQETG